MLERQVIKKARKADLVEYLIAKKYKLRKEGLNYRVVGHQGLIIQGNHWYSFSSKQGGNALDFLVKYLGVGFAVAVKELTGVAVVNQNQSPSLGKMLELPERAADDKRVIAYLSKARGLPAAVVIQLIRDKLLYQDTKGNCVFVCRDLAGTPHNAIINGTLSDVRYKINAVGGDVSYPWHWPSVVADMVTVVESTIDAMSLAVFRPKCRQGHIIALGGLHKQGLGGFLSRTVGINRVVLGLDNDEPGQRAAEEWQKELLDRGFQVWNIKPALKDWNDLLRA